MIERLTTTYASILLTAELPEPKGDFERFAEDNMTEKLQEANLELLAYIDIPEWKDGRLVSAKVYKDLTPDVLYIDIQQLNPRLHGVNDGEGLSYQLEHRLKLLNQDPIDTREVKACNKKIIQWYGDYAIGLTQFEINLLFPTVRKLLESKRLIKEGTEVVVGSNFLWLNEPKVFQKKYKVSDYPSSTVFTHLIQNG